jgi:hypothetical protein
MVSVGIRMRPAAAIRSATVRSSGRSSGVWVSASTPAARAASAASCERACPTTSRPSACAVATRASMVARSGLGPGRSTRIFRKSEPSANRSVTNRSASLGPRIRPRSPSSGICEWTLPGASAGVPALRMSVSPGIPRIESTNSGGALPRSRAVVTPKRTSRWSADRPSRCRWASASPGKSTSPAPSMTILAPEASAPMRSSSSTTVPGGRSCLPSKTRTLRSAVFMGPRVPAFRADEHLGVPSRRLVPFARLRPN